MDWIEVADLKVGERYHIYREDDNYSMPVCMILSIGEDHYTSTWSRIVYLVLSELEIVDTSVSPRYIGFYPYVR